MLELLYESPVISEKDRMEKEKAIIKDGKLTVSPRQQKLLNACIPDLRNKEKIWELLVYKDEELFLDEYEALMIGFARRSQYTLLKKFFKHRFFVDFIYVKNNHSSDYTELFLNRLAPKFVVNEKIKHKFIQLQKSTTSRDYKLFSLISNSKIFITI
jgi:hypothetical protein